MGIICSIIHQRVYWNIRRISMSSRTLKHLQLYEQLAEVIDFENAPALPLEVDSTTRTNILGLDVGIQIEHFPEDGQYYLRPGTLLYDKYSDRYYNVGFDIDESTVQVQKTNYKVLANILGTVVKTTLNWVKNNKPDVLTMIPAGGTDKEFQKKLSIYAAILEKNKYLLDNLGYTWDYYKFTPGKGLYMIKKELLK